MNKNPSCPKCQCAEVVRNGKVKEKQCVKCKNCSFRFTRLIPRGHAPSEKALAIVLCTLELSMNAISKIFDVSAQSVLNWARNFAIANYEKPAPKDAIIVELDEMWHFLNSKKTNLDMESLLQGNWRTHRLAMRWS